MSRWTTVACYILIWYHFGFYSLCLCGVTRYSRCIIVTHIKDAWMLFFGLLSTLRGGVKITHCGFCKFYLNYLGFSPAEASSSSFSLSVSCLFSSGPISPFVILSMGSSEKHRQTQSDRMSLQRRELPGACDDTCRAPDVTAVNTIFRPFSTPCSTKTSFSHRQEVTLVVMQYVHQLNKSLKQGHGGKVLTTVCF